MTLRETTGPPGPPWDRPLAGELDRLTVVSEALAANPLGDPDRRPLYVYRPPGVSAGAGGALPAVYVIQGFTGQLDMWLGRSAFEPTLVERLDAMFAAGDCPPAIIVFVDAWTSRGGSQFLNSSSTGRYLDYLCDEVVPFIDAGYPTIADRAHRGLTGKSSGGYGAMVVPMLRPEIFGGLASHAGDALFEVAYLPEFPQAARLLRDRYEGSIECMYERLSAAPTFDYAAFGPPMEMYGYACAYSPDPARPGEALLPFDVRTGRLEEEVWALWLEKDPVRMIASHEQALRSMRHIHLEAGRSDEYYLDLGAEAVSRELSARSIEHSLELFDGRHGGISYRYPGAIRDLIRALV
ncbi:MAG TPA: alpha/beta hydrolase-fold protein [Solirubrobacteraceae bacterium]|nr:alpha/beta hydrolase-fold protein [Solirubrobacteraceae bacterium]